MCESERCVRLGKMLERIVEDHNVPSPVLKRNRLTKELLHDNVKVPSRQSGRLRDRLDSAHHDPGTRSLEVCAEFSGPATHVQDTTRGKRDKFNHL